MTHTEQTFLKINISGENAKDDALGKITGFIEQNPGSELLLGGLVIWENKDGSIRTELHFDMERPDTQRVRESFAELPGFVKCDGMLFMHLRTWTE